ncbi:hypothetical protein TSUD_332970 [Trifolium subterraneum]|uniref:CNNM transmembrane domain-containing protein n=1 Tax=Trifolium subterraneum TaxID=3900 RepID=A0A2Z6MII2_TRISU|nr:hypothetical protein TSUD_332970 [Trifolium subterraneum]
MFPLNLTGNNTVFPPDSFVYDADDIPFGTVWWFVYAGISCLLVIFAGIMSGLTLGLMSLDSVGLEILQRSGSFTEKKQAAAIYPVLQKQHQLHALPLYLDKLFHPVVAVLLSVTFVLAFGEVIPQAICTRYRLYVGATFIGLVRVLMFICYPIAYPIGKVMDLLLGHDDVLFRRAQLKALVSIHSEEAGKGGELTHDEATIISGALDLTLKTAEEAMTPIESTFSLDVASKLDWEAIGKILERGHSRIPVYSGNPKNIIGILLVKNLLTLRAETECLVSSVSLRKIPRVPADMPLYDILNEFKKGNSHMAAVVKIIREKNNPQAAGDFDKYNDEVGIKHSSQLTVPLLAGSCEKSDNVVDIDKLSRYHKPGGYNEAKNANQQCQENDTAPNSFHHFPYDKDGEVIGIITLEDVFEELLQEEIVDETDVYIDVQRRIRVAAVAAASSVALGQRSTGHKPVGNQASR